MSTCCRNGDVGGIEHDIRDDRDLFNRVRERPVWNVRFEIDQSVRGFGVAVMIGEVWRSFSDRLERFELFVGFSLKDCLERDLELTDKMRDVLGNLVHKHGSALRLFGSPAPSQLEHVIACCRWTARVSAQSVVVAGFRDCENPDIRSGVAQIVFGELRREIVTHHRHVDRVVLQVGAHHDLLVERAGLDVRICIGRAGACRRAVFTTTPGSTSATSAAGTGRHVTGIAAVSAVSTKCRGISASRRRLLRPRHRSERGRRHHRTLQRTRRGCRRRTFRCCQPNRRFRQRRQLRQLRLWRHRR